MRKKFSFFNYFKKDFFMMNSKFPTQFCEDQARVFEGVLSLSNFGKRLYVSGVIKTQFHLWFPKAKKIIKRYWLFFQSAAS